jgi:hypothetical protein
MRGMPYEGGETHRPYRGPTNGRVMALLLVLAVLACHGAWSAALHQPTPPTNAGETATGTSLLVEGYPTHTAHAGGGADAPSHAVSLFSSALLTHGGDAGSAADTATILGHAGSLLFVLSAIFLVWLAGATGRRDASPLRALLRGFCPPPAAGFASQPTIPALQVFRL